MTAWCSFVLPTHTAPPSCLCWPTWPLPTLLLAVSSDICGPRCYLVRYLQIWLLWGNLQAWNVPGSPRNSLNDYKKRKEKQSTVHIPGGQSPSIAYSIVESQTTIHVSYWMHDFGAVSRRVRLTASWVDCVRVDNFDIEAFSVLYWQLLRCVSVTYAFWRHASFYGMCCPIDWPTFIMMRQIIYEIMSVIFYCKPKTGDKHLQPVYSTCTSRDNLISGKFGVKESNTRAKANSQDKSLSV